MMLYCGKPLFLWSKLCAITKSRFKFFCKANLFRPILKRFGGSIPAMLILQPPNGKHQSAWNLIAANLMNLLSLAMRQVSD